MAEDELFIIMMKEISQDMTSRRFKELGKKTLLNTLSVQERKQKT